MSECKHSWEQRSGGGLFCPKCKEKIYDVAGFAIDSDRCIDDLRAKLAAAEKVIRRDEKVKNSLNHYSHELERQCDEQELKIKTNNIDWQSKYFQTESIIRFERNRADNAEKQRDEYKAHNALLVGVLGQVRKNCLLYSLCESYEWFDIRKNVNDALQRYRGEGK